MTRYSETAIQAAWQARSQGRFEEAAARREQARALLQTVPADSPPFAGCAEQLAQLYQNSSLNARAEATLQEALARVAPLGESHPSRLALLNALANSWQQDGNLLKAVAYLEQEAAGETAPTPAAAGQPVMQGVIVSGNRISFFNGYFPSVIDTYIRLADLYQLLGRPDAATAIGVKLRTVATNNQLAVARFYEQHGQPEEAVAIYRTLAEESAEPLARSFAWQSLASLYSGQEHWTDAIAAIQQAIAAVELSNDSNIRSRAVWMRQNMATFMRQAGLVDQADQVYQQLLQQNLVGIQQTQMMSAYAQYLADTQRGAQGESLLKNYLAGNPDLEPQQQMNVLFSLANMARSKGDSKSADAYQQDGQALQPQPAGEARIGEEVREAQTALSEHRVDDAFGLALDLLSAAARAADGQQVEWLVPQIASALASNEQPVKAEQLFQRLFALAQNRSADSLQPLITVSQNYARFLIGRPDRAGEVSAAIEQYRSVLIDADGPGSGALAEPQRMQVEFERSQSQWQKAAASADELLELQASLSGDTSDPYLNDLQLAASVYVGAGGSTRALQLFRKAVTVADLLATPNNSWRRAQTRIDLAFALARSGQFDEAETLAEEAVALGRPMRTPMPALVQELEQIRRMKQAAASASAGQGDQ
ncbi:MAG: tetratricopeptide repeat protein [Bryobacteraceae bacterium]